MKTAILLAAVSCLFASVSFAQNSKMIECSSADHSVSLKVIDSKVVALEVTSPMSYADLNPFGWQQNDGSYGYSILVDDAYDTNTWFEISIKDNKVVKRQLAISGNDSDNYTGGVVAEGDAAFKCDDQ